MAQHLKKETLKKKRNGYFNEVIRAMKDKTMRNKTRITNT